MTPNDWQKAPRRKRRNPNETKRESFERLAGSRLKAIQDKLRILANLANTQHYEFDARDVDKLFAKIDRSVRSARREFDTALRYKEETGEKSE